MIYDGPRPSRLAMMLGPELVAMLLIVAIGLIGVGWLGFGGRTGPAPANDEPVHASAAASASPTPLVQVSALTAVLEVHRELRKDASSLRRELAAKGPNPGRIRPVIQGINALLVGSLGSLLTAVERQPGFAETAVSLRSAWMAILDSGRSTLGAGLDNVRAYVSGGTAVADAIEDLPVLEGAIRQALDEDAFPSASASPSGSAIASNTP